MISLTLTIRISGLMVTILKTKVTAYKPKVTVPQAEVGGP